MSIRLARGASLLGVCVVLAACSKASNKTDTAAAMAMDTTGKSAATTPAPAPQLTDANIAALLDEANAADSADGALAAGKATSASVKAFGRRMAHDHHELRKQGQDVAKKENITPQAPANDTLPAAASKLADSLKAEAKGAAWDQAYINSEVGLHQAVIGLLQAAQGAAQDTVLKALIVKATPLVQAHLTEVQDIQNKLNNPSAAAAAGGGKKKN